MAAVASLTFIIKGRIEQASGMVGQHGRITYAFTEGHLTQRAPTRAILAAFYELRRRPMEVAST